MRLRHMNRWESDKGFSAIGVLAVLTIVGVVAAAILQLAPINLRMALREQERIQALDYAESGVAYVIAWLHEHDFDYNAWSNLEGLHPLDEFGGFRDVTIGLDQSGNYQVEATGYVTGNRGELTRRVQTILSINPVVDQPLFPTHIADPGVGFQVTHLQPDENHPLYGYVLDFDLRIEIPSDRPTADPANGVVEHSGPLEGSWSNARTLVWKNPEIIEGTVTFEDPVTLYVEGNLDILGGKLDFQQGGTIYVSGDVNIKSDGVKRATITGATGPNDWIVFYGGGDLKIGEALPSGQPPVIGDEIPNVVFLMTTHEPGTDNRRLPQVSIYESRIAGGIFNPHGVINAFTGFDLVGSVVKGRYFNVGMEDPYWEDNYKAHEARMKSFSIDGHGVVQPGSVGGLEYVGWREVTS